MIFIKHRVNDPSAIASLDKHWGAEIDLRSELSANSLYLSHDPFVSGPNFNHWAELYKTRGCQGPLILNTKEDGLEVSTLEVLKVHNITNFFFLDTTIPTMVKWMKAGETRMALRLSSYETAVRFDQFKGKIEWVWVDCFDGVPLPVSEVVSLKNDFKICLVSPELQNISLKPSAGFFELAKLADAICTKNPADWKI